MEERFQLPFEYPSLAIYGQATMLRFRRSGLCDAQIWQRISSHLRVLNLIALGIKETIDVDYGSPMLTVVK